MEQSGLRGGGLTARGRAFQGLDDSVPEASFHQLRGAGVPQLPPSACVQVGKERYQNC